MKKQEQTDWKSNKTAAKKTNDVCVYIYIYIYIYYISRPDVRYHFQSFGTTIISQSKPHSSKTAHQTGNTV